MGFPILVRRHLYIESGPRSQWVNTFWRTGWKEQQKNYFCWGGIEQAAHEFGAFDLKREKTLTHWPLGKVAIILKSVIFKISLCRIVVGALTEIAHRWMPRNLSNEKSTLVKVAWCRHGLVLSGNKLFLSQCWPRSEVPYGIIMPLWTDTYSLHVDDLLWWKGAIW